MRIAVNFAGGNVPHACGVDRKFFDYEAYAQFQTPRM